MRAASPGPFGRRFASPQTGSDEAESFQDAPRLMGREVRAVESGNAGEHLLGWESTPADDDVVLVDGVGIDVADASPEAAPDAGGALGVSAVTVGCMSWGDASRGGHSWVKDEEFARQTIKSALVEVTHG